MPILPEFSLEGRSAILATSGGDESPGLALALAEAGASVFTIARTRSLLESVLDALSAVPQPTLAGPPPMYQPCRDWPGRWAPLTNVRAR